MRLACLLFILVPGIAISGDEVLRWSFEQKDAATPTREPQPPAGPTPNWCPDRSSTTH